MDRKSLLKSSVSLAAVTAIVGADQAAAAVDELVVTARKRSESLQDIPLSVQAFNAQTIAKQGIKSLEDYARLIPSLTYSSWLPGSSMVVFRGITASGDSFGGNSSAALYLNEMPITIQGGNPEVALVDIERLEAVSGPQPTTYGASAQSGVLKIVTAKPELDAFGGFADISLSAMEEGAMSYDLNGAVNIPIVEDKLALRVAAYVNEEGGFVDNILGTTADTHDYSAAFATDAALSAYPGGFGAPSSIGRVTKSNAGITEKDVGGVETNGLRATLAWQVNEDWLVTGMYAFQNTDVDGIGSYNPAFGDLNQIRFNKETKKDDWYATTLVIEGDLGFADFTSASGYMNREITYNLDSSTYLHQFQGVGAVAYNSLDIAYPGSYYLTSYYPSYMGTITGWSPSATSYYITELTDNTGVMFNDDKTDRFSQELRLTSKDEGQRYQWMIGAFYENIESDYFFTNSVDNYKDSIASVFTSLPLVREPGIAWYSKEGYEEEQWAIFGEFGFDITDKFNALLGFRYFEAEQSTSLVALNADGTSPQTCLEDATYNPYVAYCVTDPSAVDSFNRLGLLPAVAEAKDSGLLPLLTLTYEFNDDVLAYYTRSEGFRTGGANNLRASSLANRNYKADTLINNEIGVKTSWLDGRLVVNAAAFLMTWEDIQLTAADPTISFGWGQVTVNAGEAEIKGLETNFAFEATENFTFDGSFSYIDAEVTEGASIGTDVVVSDGEELPLSPDWKINLGAEYGFQVPNLDSDGYVRFEYSYVDEQTNATQGSALLTSSDILRTPGGVVQPSYDTGNLRVGIENDSWTASLSVTNIWDERGVTYIPSRWTDGRQYVVRPREFTVNFRKNF